jgi:hypothetical protein
VVALPTARFCVKRLVVVAFVATKFVVVAFPRLMLVASRLVKSAFVEKRLVLVAEVAVR